MDKKVKTIQIANIPAILQVFTANNEIGNGQNECILFRQKLSENQLDFNTDIIHIHGLSLLKDQSIRRIIQTRLDQNKPVIYSCFTEYYDPQLDLKKEFGSSLELLSRCSSLLMHDTSFLEQLDLLENWSYSALPVAPHAENFREEVFEDKKDFKVLYCADNSDDPFREQIISVIEKIKESGYSIELINNKDLYTDIISCDILIENPAAAVLSYNSLHALSYGKTILANIDEKSIAFNQRLEFSTVLKTCQDNLHYRLLSLVKQPKCLRDFGRRGIQYIKDFYNPQEIYQSYLDIYRQFL